MNAARRHLPDWLARTLRGAGMAGAVLILGLWVFTLWGVAIMSIDDGYWSNSYHLAHGALYRDHNNCIRPDDGLAGFQITKRCSVWVYREYRPLRERMVDFHWWTNYPQYFLRAPGSSFYPPVSWAWIPLWMPMAVCLMVWGLGRWLSPMRWPAGACSACGYDCRGLPETAPCPECGATDSRVHMMKAWHAPPHSPQLPPSRHRSEPFSA